MTKSVSEQLECHRSYAEYLDEISEDELLYGLLGCGMFSDKLPPMFSSGALFGYVENFSLPTKPERHRYVSFCAPKNDGGVRAMGIPHPISYAQLCLTLEDSWAKIKQRMKDGCINQKYKVSRIHLRKQSISGRLFKMNYHVWQLDGDPTPLIQINATYRVTTDISMCFPSIYSHAVPWALVGKEAAKVKRGNQLWFNKIDRDLRNCTDGETHGILIGPDSSNLIAEIILTEIDKELIAKGYRYVRNIDDYTCYTESYDGARRFLVELDEQLIKYGLLRNQKKTLIEPLPVPLSEDWVTELRRLSNELPERIDRSAVGSSLDYAIALIQKHKNISIMIFLLRVLVDRDLTAPAEELLVSRMLQLVRSYPYLVISFEDLVLNRFNVAIEDINDLSNDLYRLSFDTHDWFGAYYAFYYSLKYKFNINGVLVDDVISSGDCLLKTLEYRYALERKNKSAIQKLESDAMQLLKNGDADDNWLFVYEALSAQQLGNNSLGDLKSKGVAFISFA